MKNLLIFLFSSVILGSCTTNNYYQATADQSIFVLSSRDTTEIVNILDYGEKFYIDTVFRKDGYKKVVYNKRKWWIYNPDNRVKYSFGTYSNKPSSTSVTNTAPSSSPATNRAYSGRNYIPSKSSGGGTVNVKGYYRKNGSYVRPHTRSAPRRR